MRRPLSLHRRAQWARLQTGVNRPMRQNVFTYKAVTRLFATLMMFLGEVTMASSLKLADPSQLAGKWLVTLNAPQDSPAQPGHCLIDLQPQQTLGDGAECLGAWLGEPVLGWFPEPDGIAITDKDGSRILFFSRQHEGLYQGALKSGLGVTLQRAAGKD